MSRFLLTETRVTVPRWIMTRTPSGALAGRNSSQTFGSGPPTAPGFASSPAAATTSDLPIPIRIGPNPSGVSTSNLGWGSLVPRAGPGSIRDESGAAEGGSTARARAAPAGGSGTSEPQEETSTRSTTLASMRTIHPRMLHHSVPGRTAPGSAGRRTRLLPVLTVHFERETQVGETARARSGPWYRSSTAPPSRSSDPRLLVGMTSHTRGPGNGSHRRRS